MRNKIQSPEKLFKRKKTLSRFLNLFELFLKEYKPNSNSNKKNRNGLKNTYSITNSNGTGICWNEEGMFQRRALNVFFQETNNQTHFFVRMINWILI